jgi:hypothetical protein
MHGGCHHCCGVRRDVPTFETPLLETERPRIYKATFKYYSYTLNGAFIFDDKEALRMGIEEEVSAFI